jgi:hypothetical protein
MDAGLHFARVPRPGLPRRRATGILAPVPKVLETLFSTEIFLPRGDEYLWTPRLLELELAANALLALACLAMAATLVRRAVGKRAGLSRRTQVALAFFVACASATHILDLWVIWAPRYWVDALVRGLAAVVAAATAIALITDGGDR